MKALAWALALTVFLVFLGVYSFRLGIEPAFMHDDGRRRPAVLFGMSTALTAGMFSHTAGVFLAAALWLAFAVPLAREARPRDVVGGLLPYAAIPLLYGYFILTDSITNIWRQLAPMRGNVILGRLLALVWNGQWRALAGVVAEFVHTNLSHPGLWVGVTACLALPAIAPHRLSRAARFFAGVYCLFLLVHLLFLKHFVVTYHAMYEPTLYLALAFLAEVTTARLGELWHKPQLTKVLRVTGIAVCP